MTEVEQPPQNGIDLSANEEDESSKARPADIEQDMREMERRKRVEAIMGSKLFREELERIVDSARDGGNTAGILQQLSDIVGGPATRVGSVFKATNCMLPINDIRGVESMGYAKGEKILRCKLAAAFRLLDIYGWTQGLGAQITARLKVDQEYFLVNPYGLLYHEVTASSLNKVDMQGHVVEQGTTNFGVNKSHFVLHSAVHAARPDIRCAIYIGCSPVVAISSLKNGLLPLTKDACVLGDVTTFSYSGCHLDEEERNKLVRNLGPNSKVMLLTNHGALCCGETIEEAFFAACHIVQACETQLKLLPVGLDNLVLIPEESRKTIYEQSRRPPDDLEKKFAAAAVTADSNKAEDEATKKEDAAGGETKTKVLGQPPKWRVGGAEFEALMRMLDNAGYRTGYIYRHPLIKSDPPKPKNDVELPPAVSSLGYLLEEEELFRQGIWKKGAFTKGGDRSRWLNSPNVYQKVEVLETGTPDPKKITKWVAEGSPTHSTPVRIDDPLQFVPVNTNPKEFKRLQQQIKDNRRADKISAGPQSHILEGVTWDEANRIKDATVSQAGDHVVLMGAASKGIIQRGFQHNASVYKTPYAKNPFDNVTDDELNEYKRTVERKKKSIHGEYTDTDFSESEALSSLQTSGAQQQTKQNTTTTTTTAAVSQSEPEDIAEHQIMRIETQQAPVPSQPEVVLSDATLSFINGERSHTAVNRKPPTGRDNIFTKNQKPQDSYAQDTIDHCNGHDEEIMQNSMVINSGGVDRALPQDSNNNNASSDVNKPLLESDTISCKSDLIREMECDVLYQKQKEKIHHHHEHTMTPRPNTRTITTTTNHNTDIQMTNIQNISTSQCGNDQMLDMTSFYASPISPLPPSTVSSKDYGTKLEASLYFDTPGSCNQQDTLSYYTSCDLINSQSIETEASTVYDCVNDSNTTVANSPSVVEIYRISLHCYTPQVCGEIFQALQKPHSPLQQNYLGVNTLQDLIWNMPIQSNYSSYSITPDQCFSPPRRVEGGNLGNSKNCFISPRKTEVNSPLNSSRKSRSPYRTLSHFGFNSPQRDPQPDHKHVPPTEIKKYKPLRRSVSYEEIFASLRYIDLCEQCFEQLVRLKPEILQYRTKLRNLAEYREPTTTPTLGMDVVEVGGGQNETLDQTSITLQSNDEDSFSSNEECTDPVSVFTCHLETLVEVEEENESSVDSLPAADSMITNCSFIDKITRMNYSRESINFLNTPNTFQSQISLKEDEDQEMSTPRKPKENMLNYEELSKELRNLNLSDEREAETQANMLEDKEPQPQHVNITEIWNFNNWLGDIHAEPPIELENQQKDDHYDDLCFMDHDKHVEVTSTETQTENNDLVDNAESMVASSFNDSHPDFERSFMGHIELSRRKLEFEELLEANVRYYENREATALSDTESAMDDLTQDQSRQSSQSSSPKENIIDEICNEAAEESFPSRSFILYPKTNSYKNATSKESAATLEDEEVTSTSSQHTYNISETPSTSSHENLLYSSNNKLNERNEKFSCSRVEKSYKFNEISSDFEENQLFRSYGSTNIIGDFVMCGNRKQIIQRIRHYFDDDNVVDVRDNGKDIDSMSNIQFSLGDEDDHQAHHEENDSDSSHSLRAAGNNEQLVTEKELELTCEKEKGPVIINVEQENPQFETKTGELGIIPELECDKGSVFINVEHEKTQFETGELGIIPQMECVKGPVIVNVEEVQPQFETETGELGIIPQMECEKGPVIGVNKEQENPQFETETDECGINPQMEFEKEKRPAIINVQQEKPQFEIETDELGMIPQMEFEKEKDSVINLEQEKLKFGAVEFGIIPQMEFEKESDPVKNLEQENPQFETENDEFELIPPMELEKEKDSVIYLEQENPQLETGAVEFGIIPQMEFEKEKDPAINLQQEKPQFEIETREFGIIPQMEFGKDPVINLEQDKPQFETETDEFGIIDQMEFEKDSVINLEQEKPQFGAETDEFEIIPQMKFEKEKDPVINVEQEKPQFETETDEFEIISQMEFEKQKHSVINLVQEKPQFETETEEFEIIDQMVFEEDPVINLEQEKPQFETETEEYGIIDQMEFEKDSVINLEQEKPQFETETVEFAIIPQMEFEKVKCLQIINVEQEKHQHDAIKNHLKFLASNQITPPNGNSNCFPSNANHDEQNKENEHSDDEDYEFTILERKILRKIELHDLNKTEEIFNKIEYSIRNKLTPSKMELLVREQLLLLYSDDDICGSKNSNSLELQNDNLNSSRRSRSLTPLRVNTCCTPQLKLKRNSLTPTPGGSPQTRRSRSLMLLKKSPALTSLKLNKTCTPSPKEAASRRQCVTPKYQGGGSRTPSPSSSYNSNTSRKRNFILENIRNASVPRNTTTNQHIKRLHGNTQAIFGKNPFGPRLPASDNISQSAKKPLKSSSLLSLESPLSSGNSCGNVYTFQSKLVKGSPKFWVSMTQSPRKPKQQILTPPHKKRIQKSLHAKYNGNHTNASEALVDLCPKMSDLNIDSDIRDQNMDADSSNALTFAGIDLSPKMSVIKIGSQNMADVSETLTTTGIIEATVEKVQLEEVYNLESSSPCDNVAVTRVDAEINALAQEIQQIHPRLDSYKRKLDDFGDRVSKCARNMNECVATQEEIINDQQKLGNRIMLQQYADEIICRVQTYSLSETED